MSQPVVYVVHCVDTEGPLEEPVAATFERINERFGLSLAPSLALLGRLQAREIDLDGAEEDVARFIAPRRLDYLSLWSQVEQSVAKAVHPEFRASLADPEGNPYAFTWFIVDVVGYRDNPRRKAHGFHAVWDQYQNFLREHLGPDALGWHFHSVVPGGHPLEYNTAWSNNDWPEQVLARRIIERGWFPGLFRAGGNVVRNDLSHFLERFIPLDFSSCATADGAGAPGGQEDWRGAPHAWGGYHPSFRDYRRSGDLERWVLRCLPIENRLGYMPREDVEAAFAQAAETGKALLAYSNHDRRDLGPDLEYMHGLIRQVASDYPQVRWVQRNARRAAAEFLELDDTPAPRLSIKQDDGLFLISSDQPLFGGEPFVAIKEKNGLCYRDNPTMESGTLWAYRPRRSQQIAALGAGGGNGCGKTGCAVIALDQV